MTNILHKDYDLLCKVLFDILYRGLVPRSIGYSFDVNGPFENWPFEGGGAEIFPDELAKYASTADRRVTRARAVSFLHDQGWDAGVGPDGNFDPDPHSFVMYSLQAGRECWDEAVFPVSWPDGQWQNTDLTQPGPGIQAKATAAPGSR